MDIEDLIKRYPEGTQHKPSHAECVKFESLLGSSNLTKLKHKMGKLAPFLVSSLLHSDEATLPIATSNIKASVPYIQEQLQELVIQQLVNIQSSMKDDLEKLGKPAKALQIWRAIVYVLGPILHKNRTAVNTLLIIPEKAFKSSIPGVQKNAFFSWKELIDNFASNPEVISHAKRLKLVLQPMMSNKSKVEEVQLARADTWWHIAVQLKDKLNPEFEKVCIPLLRLVFQMPADSGRLSNSSQEESRAMLLKGSEILHRILEVPGQNLPAALSSPKKTPTVYTAPLKVPVSHLAIAKNAPLILDLLRKSLKYLLVSHPGSPLSQSLVQMLLFRMNMLSKENGKDEVQAVALFIQFTHFCIKENLISNGLKLIDSVTRLLSSKVLTSHCYHLATNSTEVMNGVPALGFLEILLSDAVFFKDSSSEKFVTVFNRLVNAGVEETNFYLSFAETVLDKLVVLATQEKSENLEIIVTLWTHTTNSLWRKIQKTQEVNQGDSLEHNFSCIISALTLPLKLHLKSSKSIQSKEMEKCWTNLCKAFLKCAALVANTEANVACEELFSEMLSLVQQETNLSSKVLGWLSFVIGITLNCIDFQSVNTMQNTASLLESPENWRKRQQRPLGNISSIVTLLGETLSSVYQLLKLKDGVAGETHVTSCLLHTKTIFNSVTLSSVLVSLVTILSPGLVSFYQKPTDTKKLSSYYNKLEQTWQSIVSAFLLYYKGPHSQDTFDALRPLLEPTLLHPQKAIQERARSLWLTAFSDTYSTLNFPESFKSVLKEVRPALIPGSQISSIDSITSLEPSLEVVETPKTRRKLIATEAQEPLKKDSFIAPKSTKKSKKDKQNNLEVLSTEDDQDFVIIPPANTSSKRVLTEHQKEVLKQKSPIPAMYSDLTQETQDTQSENSSTLLSVPSVSISESQEPVNHEGSSVIAEDPIIDLDSSNNSTLVNSISGTTDTEMAPLEAVPEVQMSDEVQTVPQNNSPDNSDDSQLSGTDSPIVLPIGISSKDVKMPRVVKRDVKLKEAFPEVKIQRLAYKESQPLIVIDLSPSKTSESQHMDILDSESLGQTPTRRSTRKTTRKSVLEVETEDTSNTSSKQKNKIQKPLDSGDVTVCDKPLDSESGSSRRRKGKEPVVDSTKVGSEKKIKTGKRKIQITDDSGCKKKGKVSHDESVESEEDLPEVLILSSHSSSQNLLNEIGAKSESSSIEVLDVVDTDKQVETIEIEESQNIEEVDQTSEEDTQNTTNVNMEDVSYLEAQEVMPDDFLNSEPVSEENYEEVHVESAEDKEEEPDMDENQEELIKENGPAEHNIPSEQEQVEGLGPDENNTNVDTIPETQVELLKTITSEGDKNSAQHLSKSDKQHETSQNITEFSTEELQVIETSSTIRKRKAASPVRSPSSRTTLTVGVGSKWKSKDSGGKKSKRILSKNSQAKGDLAPPSEEEGINNQTDSKFEKDEKENTSIISNDFTTTDESVVSVEPEKVKPSPMSQSKRKSLRGASSPLSRSQRILEAAIKNRTCESDPPSPKTGHDNLLQSPPQSKSTYVYSASASPSSGILKGKTQVSEKPSSPQNGQKRKVSFADPPVQGENEQLHSASSGDEQEFADGIPEGNESVEENSALSENELRESEDLPEDSEAPVYPDLIGCSDSAQAIFSQLTSSLWSRGLDKLLRSKGLNTIGDLSALTYPEVLGLPIVAPKVKTLKAALMKYHQNQSKTSSPGHTKLHSPPLVTENCPDEYSEEKRQPGDAKVDMDIEEKYPPDTRVDIENEDNVQDLNDVPTMGSQDLLLTQVPSRGLCASQDEDEDEAEMENAYHSPPLPSMETALNDEELLESSMLGTDSDFSLFVRPEEHHSKEFRSENQQTLNTSKDEVAAVSDQSENAVPLGQKDIEDLSNCTDEQFVTILNHMPSHRLLGIINKVLKSRLV